MSNRIFDEEQIKILSQNPNVVRCSKKSISYRKDFKVLTVKKYFEGLPPPEIFKQARFNLELIGRDAPRQCLKRWRKIFKAKGEPGLIIDNRGKKASGRPKALTGLSDKEKLKRLEAEVAYLKEENRFLAKLRKKRLN